MEFVETTIKGVKMKIPVIGSIDSNTEKITFFDEKLRKKFVGKDIIYQPKLL